jgi:hypothetical protein
MKTKDTPKDERRVFSNPFPDSQNRSSQFLISGNTVNYSPNDRSNIIKDSRFHEKKSYNKYNTQVNKYDIYLDKRSNIGKYGKIAMTSNKVSNKYIDDFKLPAKDLSSSDISEISIFGQRKNVQSNIRNPKHNDNYAPDLKLISQRRTPAKVSSATFHHPDFHRSNIPDNKYIVFNTETNDSSVEAKRILR